MLDNLKEIIANENTNLYVSEAMVNTTDDSDIKDMFLDDPESELIGAEDDHEVEKLIANLPDIKDAELSDEDLEELSENFIPVLETKKKVEKDEDDEDDKDEEEEDIKDEEDVKSKKAVRENLYHNNIFKS